MIENARSHHGRDPPPTVPLGAPEPGGGSMAAAQGLGTMPTVRLKTINPIANR
ncbi:hypothetical protein [Myxacorys almedinensis]|uniref:Uncharacterized protein n=1 Tax=Myxacorys almedinensis A TaxID=2690445 RepID=A0A8J8CN58_9CYAN|nr:hypothetical protein [Myxacorys almedinensis]NDJ18062.1 hypothetical protein [Myxacorys almedinensis A]